MSDSISASSSNSSRASMIAEPCSPIGPDTMIRSPGRSPAVDSSARGSSTPTPVVQTYILSAWPRSTTLVSPVTICTPAASAARAAASTSARSSSAGRPSSSTSARLSASGRAPDTARSLTVPFTASSPIEPPGEADRPDHEAVRGQREPHPVHRHGAGVAELRERLVTEGGQQQALDQRLAGLAAGAVRHRDALVLELRLLAAGGLDDPEDPLFPRDRRCGARPIDDRAALLALGAHTTSRSRA